MIYFFYGADSDARRRATENLLNRFSLEGEFALFQMGDLDLDLEKIEEFSSARGLFQKLLVVVINDVLSRTETENILVKHLPMLAESPNVFIVSEPRPHINFIHTAKKLALEAREFPLSKSQREPFNNFLVSDAFGRRDRKGAWLSLMRAVARGVSGEEITGVLFWQIKNMLLVKKSLRLSEIAPEKLNLKPFVFHKARDFAGRFSENELQNANSALVDLIHLGRRRGEELLVGLELFLLRTL